MYTHIDMISKKKTIYIYIYIYIYMYIRHRALRARSGVLLRLLMVSWTPGELALEYSKGPPDQLPGVTRSGPREHFWRYFFDVLLVPHLVGFWCQLGPKLRPKIDQKSIQIGFKISSIFWLISWSMFNRFCCHFGPNLASKITPNWMKKWS